MKAPALAALLIAAGLAAMPVQADWQGFYTPTERPKQTSPESLCIREILAAQERHGIPGNLLLAIGLQEAGRRRNETYTVWPYTVNADGEGRFFETAAAAQDWVATRRAEGVTSIDIGCMQVNLRWHPDAFASPGEGFDPAVNVDYAARLLKRLYARTGDWVTAAGAYHSQTPDLQEAYLGRLKRNVEVANLRFEEFRTLASKAGKAPKPARPAPQEGVFWTAWLGRESGEAPRSLFASGPIEPILPAFAAVPGAGG